MLFGPGGVALFYHHPGSTHTPDAHFKFAGAILSK